MQVLSRTTNRHTCISDRIEPRQERVIMKSNRNSFTFWLFCVIGLLGGCGFTFTPAEEEINNYFGVNISDFNGSRAIPVQGEIAGASTADVSLPIDLLETAPEEARIILTAPDVDLDIDTAATQANPAFQGNDRSATITFRLASSGNDACSSTTEIGPFEFSMIDNEISISTESLQLTPTARSITESGEFEMCAEAAGDFIGTMALTKVSLEFGTLKSKETKVEICHIPPGSPDNAHTITVASSAVDAHLAHGDYLGPCIEEMENLMLASACSDDPDVERRWEINNSNNSDIDVNWTVDTSQTGTITATPGISYFTSATTTNGNIAEISWLDETGTEQTTTATSTGETCTANPDDSDADGVDDSVDLCPATPSSETVDNTGCSCSQLDDDNDGIDNCDDQCANTQVDDPVNSNGCACIQLDSDSDGIDDCNDLCPVTESGAVVDAAGCATAVADAGEDVVLTEIGCITLQGSATGGEEPYTYSWSASGWEGSTEQNPSVVPTETTTYTLTVTDWSTPPASVSDTVTITVQAPTILQYTIENLGSPSSNASYPANLNDSGDVVGYYYTDSWKKRAFLYSNGTMTDIGTLGGEEAYANDINNAGQVVGQAQDTNGNWRAYVWTQADGMQDLGTFGGSSSAAYAINDSGQITGNASIATTEHAFLYDDGVMSYTGTSDYFHSGALDINDSGQVVGTYLAWGYDQQGFIYDNGTFTDLGSPLLSGSRAVGINNDGLVVGYSWGSGSYRSFLYACGEVIDLGSIDGFPKTYVWGISNAGQIAGNCSTADSSVSHATIYRGGQLYDLNDLLPNDHGWDYLTIAFAVNDAGQITGYGRINGQFRGFLLTPVN